MYRNSGNLSWSRGLSARGEIVVEPGFGEGMEFAKEIQGKADVGVAGEDGELRVVGCGAMELDGGVDGGDHVQVAVEEEDLGVGAGDGGEGAGVVGIEGGDLAGAVEDGGVVGVGEEIAGDGEEEPAEVRGFFAQGGEGCDGDDGGDARVGGGVENAGGGAIGGAEDTDGRPAEAATLELGGELGEVGGILDAEGEVVAGRFPVATEIDEDGTIAGALEGAAGGVELMVIAEDAMEEQNGAARRAIGVFEPNGEGGIGRADVEAKVVGGIRGRWRGRISDDEAMVGRLDHAVCEVFGAGGEEKEDQEKREGTEGVKQ
jgi:hypothetical protein